MGKILMERDVPRLDKCLGSWALFLFPLPPLTQLTKDGEIKVGREGQDEDI